MKKPKFKYVKQVEKRDCNVACLAMITGKSLKQIRYYLKNDFSKHGLSVDGAIEFLGGLGIDVVECRPRFFKFGKDSNRILLKPFADIHIVVGRLYADVKHTHAAIMNAKGELFDPAGEDLKNWKQFWEILHVTGCYYSK